MSSSFNAEVIKLLTNNKEDVFVVLQQGRMLKYVKFTDLGHEWELILELSHLEFRAYARRGRGIDRHGMNVWCKMFCADIRGDIIIFRREKMNMAWTLQAASATVSPKLPVHKPIPIRKNTSLSPAFDNKY